ncbi:T9SS type A sorting domain-containing protein [Aestuariibaculum sp. M13]|uniref:FG-GAP repeat domain-containing protein n=1 Tax=Aestuariibaculum sp. M13 TaxID=2967132 RepID=UPI002159DB1D|nr:T9SS type A sorting domain-containing protein [Aestuariibaculum sp. M13]MCR8667724.1 T9SS type A sorting domain-containing protein [Aestuariibaculum sp. M13]
MKKILLFLAGLLFIIPTYSQSLFGPKQTISTSTGYLPYVIDSKDLDNDSYIDIVIGTNAGNTIEWYKNNKNGTFTLQPLVSSTISSIGGLVIADIDGDNDNDIIATSSLSNNLVWYENNGAGEFSSARIIASGLTRAEKVKVADIDNNNTLDIIVSVYDLDVVQWYSNDGSANFSAAQPISNLANYRPVSFDVGDVDNDGDMDVVVAYDYTYLVKLFLNNYTGSNSVSFTQASNNVSINDFKLKNVSFGDIDNDNDLEILKIDKNQNPKWYNIESDGSFTEHTLSSSVSNPAFAQISDFDGDSKNDIAIGYSSTSSNAKITWYKNSNLSTENTIDDSQNNVLGFTVNDFDNDGDLDIASVSTSENHLNWFENLTVSKSLSSDDFNKNTITIYPNPTSDYLYFNNYNLSNKNVSIFNMLGKRVLTSKIESSNNSLNVSFLTKGLYIIQIQETNTTLKFIKQ